MKPFFVLGFLQGIAAAENGLIRGKQPTAQRRLNNGAHENLCMDAVYQDVLYGNPEDKKQKLGCTANDVSAVATGVNCTSGCTKNLAGQDECTLNTSVTVDVSTTITFHASRYDFGIYVYAGGNASIIDEYQEEAGLYGDSCFFTPLTENFTDPSSDNVVTDVDMEDECLDVKMSGKNWDFPFDFKNLTVPCTSTVGILSNLTLLTCFAWSQSENSNTNCSEARDLDLPVYTWPGTVSKCACDGINLPIITVDVSSYGCCLSSLTVLAYPLYISMYPIIKSQHPRRQAHQRPHPPR